MLWGRLVLIGAGINLPAMAAAVMPPFSAHPHLSAPIPSSPELSEMSVFRIAAFSARRFTSRYTRATAQS
jgi:hypothetical protein